MPNIARRALLAGASGLFGLKSLASPMPQELQAALPLATLSGQATLKFWGLALYQASLWVTPGFVAAAYDQSPFALTLDYLRDFKGQDIARRSISEMRHQLPLDAAQQARWEGQLRALFPDVTSGDRITGVHLPGTGAQFWHNGRLLGDIRDSNFAKLFFGIWLAPQTSEPQLRLALLARSGSVTRGGATP